MSTENLIGLGLTLTVISGLGLWYYISTSKARKWCKYLNAYRAGYDYCTVELICGTRSIKSLEEEIKEDWVPGFAHGMSVALSRWCALRAGENDNG